MKRAFTLEKNVAKAFLILVWEQRYEGFSKLTNQVGLARL